MIEISLEKDVYSSHFAALERRLNGREAPWLKELRQSAMARFSHLGFPTTNSEEWRFTNVAPLARTSFRPAASDEQGVSVERLESLTFGGSDVVRIVFVNGVFSPALSRRENLSPGVRVESLAAALEAAPEDVRRHLARYAAYENQCFAALNTALMQDGAFVLVPRGADLKAPIHILHVSNSTGEPHVCHPRTLIVAGESAQIAVVESYLGASGSYFTNAVTEIVAGANAVVDHYKLQRESLAAYHVASVDIYAGPAANASSHSIALGGALVRNDVNIVLDGEGAEGTINGLYVVRGRQHVDNHTSIDHAKPHCSSRELYKGVLDGQSRAVFNGRIRVRKDAQKTDSKQTNKNLLLSDEALVNSNPQLEIYADDVKCTHGATIGQLDENALFYLQSRGIGDEAARHLLTYAFAGDIVERIKVPSLRHRLDELLVHRFRDHDEVEAEP
jgi:Fe-S cluster assembly protein SufD